MKNKMMEVTKVKIGKNTFFLRPFPAMVSARLSGDLANIFGPFIGALGSLNWTEGTDLMNVNPGEVFPALSQALMSLSGEQLEKVMRVLLLQYRNISVNGEDTDGEVEVLDEDLLNEVFCGEVQDMYLLCYKVISLNFKGFFKKLEGLFGALQGLMGQTSIPTNGEPSTQADSATSN